MTSIVHVIVESSNIKSIGYDGESRTLEVAFLNGGVYRYADVPATSYAALMAAESKGSHFAAHIRPHYRATKVEGASAIPSAEELARALHEAGREAVEKGAVINKVPGQPFFEWDEITEQAREGRRIQARYLLERYTIIRG